MLRKNKVLFFLVVSSFMIVLLTGCLGGGEAEGEKEVGPAESFVFKLGHAVNERHPYHLGAVKFKEIVEKETGGNVEIKLFPNNQLGTGERAHIEGLQLGTIDIVVTSTGPLSGFERKFMLFDFPFLFRDRAHAFKVLDGEIGQHVLGLLEKQGIKGLAWYENGFRHLTNSKHEVLTPEDVQGLKLRTMENEVHMAIWKAMGADPTSMAWGEVFTALQQGTVDGQENPIPIIYTQKVYEVQKYLSLTGHVFSPAMLLMSKGEFDSLPQEYQTIVLKAAKESAVLQREMIAYMENEQIEKLKEAGMVVSYPDKTLFLEATKIVYKEFKAELGEAEKFLDKIINME